MNNNSGGWLGALGVIGVIALLFVGRRIFPALSTILLIGGGVFLLLILAIFILALVVSRGDGKKSTRETMNSEIMAAARADLLQVRRQSMRVRHKEINRASGEIAAEAEKILRIMKDRPECILQARRFWNYYLPTLRKILEKYAYLEENGQAGQETTENTAACLAEILTAMKKQREKLFAGDILDLSAEMEVLKTMCQRDGLLNESDFCAMEEQTQPSTSAVSEPSESQSERESGEEFTDGYTDDLEDGKGTPMGG